MPGNKSGQRLNMEHTDEPRESVCESAAGKTRLNQMLLNRPSDNSETFHELTVQLSILSFLASALLALAVRHVCL